MATSKEGTLQIKQQKGVDTYTEGTQQDPDVFEVLQNFKVPNPGEMRAINGITKLARGIPGIQKVIHTRFLDTSKDKGLVVWYTPSTSLPAAPGANFTFSTSGGGAISRDVYVEYVVAGGGKIATKYAATSIQTDGLVVGIDANVSGSAYYAVQSINVYVKDAGGAIVWSGSAWRVDNEFPASMTVFPPGAKQTSDLLSVGIPPGSFTATPTIGGYLQSDKIYYLGLGPWFGAKNSNVGFAECAFHTASNNLGAGTLSATGVQVFSVYLPAGNSCANIVFDYCPLNPPDTTAVPTDTDLQMDMAIVYAGVTPEDMMPACVSGLGTINGYSSTVPKTVKVSDAFSNTAVTDADDTINFNNGANTQVPVGACLKAVKTSGGGDITGVFGTPAVATSINGKYFYVVSSTLDSATGNSIIKIATSPNGSVLDLATSGAANWTFTWAQYTTYFSDLPRSCDRIPSCAIWATNLGGKLYPEAVAGRGVGVTKLTVSDPSAATTPVSLVACGIFTSLDTSFKNFRHIAYPVYQSAVDIVTYTGSSRIDTTTLRQFQIPINDVNSAPFAWDFQSRQYGNRLWCVNNYNEPFYSNGYVLKSGIPSNPGTNTFVRWPITKFIEFFKDRMILASDGANSSYAVGYFYFSSLDTGSGDIQNFSAFPSTLPVNTADQSIINGMSIYSQDVSTVGPQTFLIIGKQESIFSWDGSVDSPANQITRATGFAGPNCYTVSRFGPVYVGRDNVYLFRSSQDVIPVGDSIKNIIQGLTATQLANVVCTYHEEDVKIGYTDSSNIDRELWLRLHYTGGGIERMWSGPHILKEYTAVSQIPNFDSQINVRVSYQDLDLYRRQDPGSFLNDGQDQQRRIKIRNLGLQQDHLLKLITRVYLALRIVQDETFDISFESQDGSQSIVAQATATSAGNVRQLMQYLVGQRFLARVLTLSIENMGHSDMSVYDLSILFETIRRRALP